MAYDLTRCPQNQDEFRAYFYTLIGCTYGAPATGWEATLSASYPWQGSTMRIPEGVGPGIKQTAGAPFFGLTQQWSGGVPKARVFLPSDQADDNGYYTRCMQYLDDAPSGGGLVWAWYYVAGNAYTPIQGADSGSGGVTPPPTDPQLEQRVETLEAQVAQLSEQLRQVSETALQAGGKVGLRLAEGQVLCVTAGGPTAPHQPVTFESRAEMTGAWEQFELLKP